MKEATLIYPHQLYKEHPALQKDRRVYLVEEPLFLTEFPVHAQKLLLHRLSMQAYRAKLEETGYEVRYIEITEVKQTADVFKIIAADKIDQLHIADTTDDWLERRINTAAEEHGFTLKRYESKLFILNQDEAKEKYQKSGRFMAKFYKGLRLDKKILLTEDDKPLGGQWSFDEENREKLPKDLELPADLKSIENEETLAAKKWLEEVEAKVYFPWTHETAEAYLEEFLTKRLFNFGTYEDAMTERHTRLFHSTLTPLLNVGLLETLNVIKRAIAYAEKNEIALNNLEGFVRQILGWREFIRAAYEVDGGKMRRQNFWQHQRKLPTSFWNGTTEITPVDKAIGRALENGYSHHIERLMVLGNFMLLNQIDPDEVYRWFMAMYVDAYDWVMVPNVYGMSQFADGGLFATKPYISGSNYLKKMSDYPKGDWEEIWTALYWNFIAEHEKFFTKNHRLSMMPRLLNNMNPEKRDAYKKVAKDYFSKLEQS